MRTSLTPEERKQRVRDSDHKYAMKVKQAVIDGKNKPCKACGIQFASPAMCYHHRNPAEKSFQVAGSYAVAGLPRVLEEIAKCDVYCLNCHAILHGELR